MVYVCIFGFKGASTSKVIGARNEMMMDDYDGQMIFGDLVGLKLPDIRHTGEEKPRKNLSQETYPDRGSNPGPLRDKRACYHLFHSGGRKLWSSYTTCTNWQMKIHIVHLCVVIRDIFQSTSGLVSWASTCL